MALQGTLDTFALPDVLRLLATTTKTGRLVVQGDRGNGTLHLRDGAVVAGETSLAVTDTAHEVLFELLRLEDGSFVFDADSTIEASGDAVDVESVITDAEAAHAEWKDLSEVVPSLDVGIVLVEDLPEDTTTIDRDRWKLIVTIGSGTTVRTLGERLGMTELPVLRAARSLVDDGLATIETAVAAAGNPRDAIDLPPDVGEPLSLDDVEAAASSVLPSLDDDVDGVELFGGDAPVEELPEPLPGEAASGAVDELLPDEAALLEAQLAGLPADQRDLVERAADLGDPVRAEELLDELPDGAIDRVLMRRFLGSVRN